MHPDQPKTIDEAAYALLECLSSDERAEFRRLCREDLISTHFSLGIRVRNQLGLWRSDCSITKPAPGDYLAQHPDDLSSRVIERAWELLHGFDS